MEGERPSYDASLHAAQAAFRGPSERHGPWQRHYAGQGGGVPGEAKGGRFDQLRAPRSEQLTSMTVPFVITPSDVYSGDCGFFFT